MKTVKILRAVLLTLCLGGTLVAPAAAEDACTTIPLEPTPLWVSSAAWSVDGSELLLVDAAGRKVLRYPVTGDPGDALLVARDQEPAPSILRTVGDGYLLERDDGILERRNESFEVVESRRLPGALQGSDGELGSVNQWIPVGDRLLVFGDVQRPDGSWVSGVVATGPAGSEDFQVLRSLELDDPGRALHLVPNHYLAELEGAGWFLLMEEEPALREVRFSAASGAPETRRVSLPEASRTRPELVKYSDFDATRAFYADLASSTLPVGVFGHEGRLYLLQRGAAGQATTRWTLQALDPEDGRVLRSLTLPSRAPHVLLVPGDSRWALIEKGPVEGLGVQKVLGAKLLPARWLTDAGSPLTGGAALGMCR